MSYVALYRKLRPKTFEQVVGQKHIIKTLKNEIQRDRIGHCYLFCGTRGTGKTSTAKIFAKVLNCENPIHNSPCGKCSMCIAFDENRSLNIIEIDAASNNGVDDIREIKEEVKYPPTKGRYKIYIIDEVHMLSIGAFNALLKTLEEPPSYVIFILATTDPHKIPVTILSRCQRFDFKRISNKDMVDTLKNYMIEENVNIDEDALYYIAKISDGAMRDALSILEQCISFYYEKNITLKDVLEIVGAVDDEIFFEFVDAILNFSSIDVIKIIDELIYNGRDITQFVSDLINHIRNLIIASISNVNTLDISDEKFEALKEQAQKTQIDYLTKLIDEFCKIQANLKYSFDERIILEASCIKLCSAISEEDITDIKQKIKFLEKNIKENKQVVYVENVKQDLQNNKQEKEEKPRELAVDKDIKEAIDNFSLVINRFKPPEKVYLEWCSPKNLEDKFLYLVCKETFKARLESIIDKVQDAMYDIFKKQYEIKVLSEEKYEQEYKKAISKPVHNNIDNNIDAMKELFPEGMLDIN